MALMDQIEGYLASLPGPKQADLRRLHGAIRELNPGCELWFLDGQDETGKVVSNPNIGYGTLIKSYAGGKTKPFYQVGISANTAGLSVYLMGMDDKAYLQQAYGPTIGKASLTGYCIKFKALKDVDWEVLTRAIQDGMARTRA